MFKSVRPTHRPSHSVTHPIRRTRRLVETATAQAQRPWAVESAVEDWIPAPGAPWAVPRWECMAQQWTSLASGVVWDGLPSNLEGNDL